MKRRRFLKSGLTLGTGSLLTGVYAFQIEPFWLEFVFVKMGIQNLPDALVGKTLMQISDLHIGPVVSSDFIIKSLVKAQVMQPDIVVYTGDFVSYQSADQIDELTQVMKYHARGSIATLGILGNHDYGYGWSQSEVAENIVDSLEDQQIKILRNESIDIKGLNIIGLDDFWSPNYGPSRILSNLDPDRSSIVLCHNPDVLDQPIWYNYSGWVLSGHTHGGQCKPPFLNPPVLPVSNKKYTAGLFKLENMRNLYINRALGHTWQVRFNVRPEITIFQLDRA